MAPTIGSRSQDIRLSRNVRIGVPVCDLREDELGFLARRIPEFFAEVEKKKCKVHVRLFLSRYRG